MNRFSLVTLAVLVLVPIARGSGQDVSPADRLSSPRRSIDNFLKWQNPPNVDMEIASEAFAIDPSLSSTRRQELARQLKAVLDGRGLRVQMDAIPDRPDFKDEVTGRSVFQPYPSRLPELMLVRSGNRWLFSRETLGAVPGLYSATYSATAQYLIRTLPPPFRRSLFGVALWQVLGVFVLVSLGWLIRRLSATVLRSLAKWLILGTKPKWDERFVFQTLKPISFLIMTLFLLLFYADLQLPVAVNAAIKLALELMIAASLIWLSFDLVDFLCNYLFRWAANTDSRLDDQLVPMIRKTLKIVAFVLGTIAIVQNYGYSVSSVVAGLGIGGLAIALAAKDTIANLFGSVTIFADQPFQIGDWVVADGVEGTVEEVGFRSTRVRTFYNSLISIPNSSLANGKIDNMGIRQYRRFKSTLGLTYATKPEQMEAFVEGVRAIILASPDTRKDYFEVHFHGFGDFSLNVLLYCFFEVDSWSRELSARHHLLLEVLRLAQDVGVEFAFPTQTLHVDSVHADAPREVGRPLSNAELASAAVSYGPGGSASRPTGPVLESGGETVDFRSAPGRGSSS